MLNYEIKDLVCAILGLCHIWSFDSDLGGEIVTVLEGD